MKRNFSLLFFLKKGKTDQEGCSSVYLRITVDKKRAEVATGKQCSETDWDNGKFKGRTTMAKTLNLYLRQLESKIHEAHRHLLLLNEDLTA